jgi:hypothetical protein
MKFGVPVSCKKLSEHSFKKIGSVMVILHIGYKGISATTFRILWPIRLKSGADFHVLSVASYKLSENHCPESQMLLKGMNEILLIFSTFFVQFG